jgi:hypothetical protein
MNPLAFNALQRQAEDAEIAAVLATIPKPDKLELEPIDDQPHAPQSRVLFNALESRA